jgi:hypothetical protein
MNYAPLREAELGLKVRQRNVKRPSLVKSCDTPLELQALTHLTDLFAGDMLVRLPRLCQLPSWTASYSGFKDLTKYNRQLGSILALPASRMTQFCRFCNRAKDLCKSGARVIISNSCWHSTLGNSRAVRARDRRSQHTTTSKERPRSDTLLRIDRYNGVSVFRAPNHPISVLQEHLFHRLPEA